MLISLNIRNVAIIDHLEIEIGPGLNLLTGETGAGKSIIIDALGLTLGARGSPDLVHTGAKEAIVEAIFSNPGIPEIERLAEEAGFPLNSELILRRRLSAKGGGGSKAYVNDSRVNISTLSRIGELLVTVHGQGEGDELLGPEGQLALLDLYAALGVELRQVSSLYGRVNALQAELERINTDERARIRELDLLEHQINEIEAAKLDLGEEGKLKGKSRLLSNAERLKELSQTAFQDLYAGEEAITAKLSEVAGRVADLEEFEPSFTEARKRLDEARFHLEDVATALRDFISTVEDDPKLLEQVELRLDTIRTLQRKYGETTKEVLLYLEKAKTRRDDLRTADERAEKLQSELGKLQERYDKACRTLSSRRAASIPDFAKEVSKHLSELAMEKARFQVDMQPHPRGRTRTGTDRVAFMISPNPGEELKPLARIASGGELSRLMLAIKSCAIEPKSKRTVIFDEVDAGIGGRVAEFVGRKLKRLSASQQVICITHLPQIAVYAGRHSRVVKKSEADKTKVGVQTLDGDQRIEELARMLGGEEITSATRANARQLLKQARAHAKHL